MAGERWVFTPSQLTDTPSRKCNVEADRELNYRQQAANLIQDMGQRLQVTQLCINTAIVYMHRFYMFHSFTKFHRNNIAAACLFLAAKVEEQPRKLEHVLRMLHMCLHRDASSLDTKSDAYQERVQDLIFNENVLLQTLGFEITVDHPHTHIVRTSHLVKASKDLAQTSYFLATNSLHLTTMCLKYYPTVVACVCIHLACKWSGLEIPKSSEDKEWFYYTDPKVTIEILEELTQEFLEILDKCPSKLKKKIMTVKAACTGNEPSRPSAAPMTVSATSSATSVDICVGAPAMGKTSDAAHTHTNHERKDGGAVGKRAPPTGTPNMRRVRTEPSLTPKEYMERREREHAERMRIERERSKLANQTTTRSSGGAHNKMDATVAAEPVRTVDSGRVAVDAARPPVDVPARVTVSNEAIAPTVTVVESHIRAPKGDAMVESQSRAQKADPGRGSSRAKLAEAPVNRPASLVDGIGKANVNDVMEVVEMDIEKAIVANIGGPYDMDVDPPADGSCTTVNVSRVDVVPTSASAPVADVVEARTRSRKSGGKGSRSSASGKTKRDNGVVRVEPPPPPPLPLVLPPSDESLEVTEMEMSPEVSVDSPPPPPPLSQTPAAVSSPLKLKLDLKQKKPLDVPQDNKELKVKIRGVQPPPPPPAPTVVKSSPKKPELKLKLNLKSVSAQEDLEPGEIAPTPAPVAATPIKLVLSKDHASGHYSSGGHHHRHHRHRSHRSKSSHHRHRHASDRDESSRGQGSSSRKRAHSPSQHQVAKRLTDDVAGESRRHPTVVMPPLSSNGGAGSPGGHQVETPTKRSLQEVQQQIQQLIARQQVQLSRQNAAATVVQPPPFDLNAPPLPPPPPSQPPPKSPPPPPPPPQ